MLEEIEQKELFPYLEDKSGASKVDVKKQPTKCRTAIVSLRSKL